MNKINTVLIITLLLFSSHGNGQCFTKLSSAFSTNFAQKSDGTLWNWGNNGSYQFGNTTLESILTPTQSLINGSFTFFESGRDNTYVIKSDGTLWGTGDNDSGALGIGSTAIASATFVQIGTATNWKQISAGSSATFGLRTDNTLWGWGLNNEYQMGDNTCCTNRLSPAQIGTAADWKQVSACTSESSILAVKTNGTLWGWGSNGSGINGPSNVSGRPIPTQITTATDWASLSTGASHALALKTNGTLWAWGGGFNGQTGDTLPQLFFRDTPVQVGTDTWLLVSAGFQCSFGIKPNGTLWAWGRNDRSQLGDGTTTDRRQPVQIGTDTDWISVSGGFRHAVALKSNGALYTWGDNFFGQLGNGTDVNETTPIYISVTGCTLGVAAFEKARLVISPNPATTQITIQYDGDVVATTIKIYDLIGREVYSTSPLASGLFQATLPVDNLQTGTYILSIQNQGKTLVSNRFVKH